jgi:general secretion pathway protein D
MRRFVSLATIVFVVLAVTIPLGAENAHSAYNKGVDAEKRQDYERAFEYYQEAYRQKPKDLRYRTAYEHTKFLAGAAHVHRGQLLRDGGKLDEALVEFQKASTIDPSSFIAQQELRRTQDMINKATNPPQSVAPMPDGLRKRLAEAQGPVELSAISNVPITLKLTEDTKVIYETVGKLAGINVLFDPDYTSRKIRIELNGVTLEEALGIIALESKTFWRPVTPNTVFVATDNPAKRKELDQSVIKTFYLSNLSQATELQDVVNAVRTLLEVQRIQQLQSQNAIIVRGTPDQIALAQKLVDDLDKAKSEVVIDVVVMQVSRDKSRTLGINPPTSTSISLNNNINTTTTTATGPAGGTGTVTQSSGTNSASGGINLNRIGDLNATDFTITIPGATATAIMGDSSTKIIQNPQIRALDGQKATLKIGDRVPVATGSFQPGIGGVGINPLVNTQFQYLDVGVNIDITPRVHAGREVSLKVSLDISSVTGNSNIGGISQPVIGQRKIEHEIRLKEGEVNLLGGMIEEDQTQSISGLPILAQIPFLKYFFGQDTRDHRENELVFALVPHIVRGPDVNDSNQRLIDVGTANALQLRHISKVETVPAGQAAALAGAPGQAPPTANPARPTPSVAPVTGASFLFDPGAITAAKAQTFTVNILISGAQNVYSVPLQLNYDPNKLQLMNVSNGGFLSQDGQTVALVHREDETTGTLQITATRPPNSGGVSGQGTVVTLTFMAKASGQSPLTITRGGARDPSMQAITVNGAQAVVTIQ